MAEIEKKKSYLKALMELRSLVMTGELPAGERVSEVALARRIGVSRTPLREAMGQLVDEALLERLPTGGCQVRRFTREDVAHSIELRGVIEGTAARLAAERGASAEGLAACRGLIARIDRALGSGAGRANLPLYAELNAELHVAIAALSESEVMMREAERVSRLPLAGPSAFLGGQSASLETLSSLAIAQHQHRALIEAIGAREGARAEALAREHARLARRNLDDFLESREAPAEIPGLSLIAEEEAAG